ncbi:MAG: hypothetical protein P8Y45_18065 [Exilibacterium sp.]
MNRPSRWHFPRTDLAQAYLQQLEAGLNSIAIFAERRKGKTEFLTEDLQPCARARGLRTAYINFWERKSDPVYCITQGVRRALEADSPRLLRKWKKEFTIKLGVFQAKSTASAEQHPEIASEALDLLIAPKGGLLLMFVAGAAPARVGRGAGGSAGSIGAWGAGAAKASWNFLFGVGCWAKAARASGGSGGERMDWMRSWEAIVTAGWVSRGDPLTQTRERRQGLPWPHCAAQQQAAAVGMPAREGRTETRRPVGRSVGLAARADRESTGRNTHVSLQGARCRGAGYLLELAADGGGAGRAGPKNAIARDDAGRPFAQRRGCR